MEKMSNLQSEKKVEYDIYKAENLDLYFKLTCACKHHVHSGIKQ